MRGGAATAAIHIHVAAATRRGGVRVIKLFKCNIQTSAIELACVWECVCDFILYIHIYIDFDLRIVSSAYASVTFDESFCHIYRERYAAQEWRGYESTAQRVPYENIIWMRNVDLYSSDLCGGGGGFSQACSRRLMVLGLYSLYIYFTSIAHFIYYCAADRYSKLLNKNLK